MNTLLFLHGRFQHHEARFDEALEHALEQRRERRRAVHVVERIDEVHVPGVDLWQGRERIAREVLPPRTHAFDPRVGEVQRVSHRISGR
jgi:hypothetical protein